MFDPKKFADIDDEAKGCDVSLAIDDLHNRAILVTPENISEWLEKHKGEETGYGAVTPLDEDQIKQILAKLD